MTTIKKKRPSYGRRRSSSSLSASMTENTLLPLASLIEKPGLAFYTAYAHVEDVSSHLMSLRGSGGGSDKYSLSTLASCILSSQELLLGLLYRTDICDQRPGVDKLALGLAVKDILCQFNSLLTIMVLSISKRLIFAYCHCGSIVATCNSGTLLPVLCA